MHIVRLRISGLRGVQSADVALVRHALLIGLNTSRKTTINEALIEHQRPARSQGTAFPKSIEG